MRKLLYGLPVILMACLFVLFYLGLGKDPKLLPSILVGEPAPQFSLSALLVEDQVVGSQTFDGEVVLINFFASWCGPCRIEHPLLMQVAADGELPIYGINYKDKPATAKRWLKELGDPFAAIAVDDTGLTGIDWGVYGLPESFLINAQGEIVYKHVGPLTPDVLYTEIMPIVKELRK